MSKRMTLEYLDQIKRNHHMDWGIAGGLRVEFNGDRMAGRDGDVEALVNEIERSWREIHELRKGTDK